MMQDIFFVFIFVILIWTLHFDISAAERPRIFEGKACRLVIEFAEVVRQIPEYEVKKLEVVKYNRSTPVVNIDFVFHDEKVMDYKIWLDGYEKLGMEHIYKRSAIAMQCTMCDAINGGFLMASGLESFGNVPRKCPLKLDHVYYLHNYFMGEKATPPTFPGYKWRFDMQIGPEGKKDTNKTALLRFYVRIEWYDRKNGRLIPTVVHSN